MSEIETPPEEPMVFNGIDGASGEYLLPEMNITQLSALAQGQTLDPDVIEELKERVFEINNPHAGVEADARDLAETGWAVIFAHDAEPGLLDALKPLLALRQEQAGERFKTFTGGEGYRPGESKGDFLKRHGMGPGPANPDKVPYYLLIVGDPGRIPYRFQYQLDVQYAVGRIHFDTLEDYARYAQSVVQAEKGLNLAPQAAFFGVANPDDRATAMSAEHLVGPLAERILSVQSEWIAEAERAKTAVGLSGEATQWEIQTLMKDRATKAQLGALLNGSQAPSLFFSASHGIAFPNGHERQLPHQGALICQDWPGPQNWRGALGEDFYFAADDLSSEGNLLGTMAFFFACYGAGTPRMDEFAHQIWQDQPERREIAPHDFVARLPQRMLSLPRGGALAVVGHVERAWGVSFYWGEAGPQLQVFEDCFERLMKGNYPIGYALEVFNNRYAEISSDLSNELDEIRHFSKKPNDRQLANMWTANNDARNYVIIGDPAVRLSTQDRNGRDVERPTIPEITSPPLSESPKTSPASEKVPQPVMGTTTDELIDYGLLDSFKQAQASMGASLGEFVGKLGDYLGTALDEATSLEIATYVSDDMAEVKYERGRFSGARLRALTRIEIDGDTLICVPEEDGDVDTELWDIHMDMVGQAQASRAELLKTVVSAATGLVDLLKP
jgi:hypothetical protein